MFRKRLYDTVVTVPTAAVTALTACIDARTSAALAVPAGTLEVALHNIGANNIEFGTGDSAPTTGQMDILYPRDPASLPFQTRDAKKIYLKAATGDTLMAVWFLGD